MKSYSQEDERLLSSEAQSVRTTLLEQTRQTRSTLNYLPSEFRVGPAFLTALGSIETTLPAQLQEITALAAIGDWEAVRLRLDNESKQMETAIAAHVRSINRDLDEELPRAVTNMRNVRERILIIVPATALSTVFIAALFGWAVARRILELRVEERVNERTRIAREFHDTLLQSFQGALLKFHAVAFMLPDDSEARRNLEAVIEQARQAVAEGRDAIQGLRASASASNDLAMAISTLGERLAAEHTGLSSSGLHVRVEGTPRNLAPLVRDEVYQIASEAVRNAFRHARAERIEVDILYEKRQLRLRVRDNGIGITKNVLDGAGRAGHYGLPGMRERARLAGGKLAVWSEPNSGTEIELSIPGSLAFAKSSAARPSAAG